MDKGVRPERTMSERRQYKRMPNCATCQHSTVASNMVKVSHALIPLGHGGGTYIHFGTCPIRNVVTSGRVIGTSTILDCITVHSFKLTM